MRIALASTAILTAALAALPATPAAAQSMVERCRAFTNVEDRIACLQISLEAAEAGIDPSTIAPAAPAGGAAPAPARGQAELGAEQVRPSRSGGDDDADFLGIDLPFIGGGSARGRDAVPAQGLGAEQINARSGSGDDEARVYTSVVGVREQPFGGWVFELENGQVWRQLTDDTAELRFAPDTPTPAEMWSSWAGGYRMRLPDEDIQLRVERLQ